MAPKASEMEPDTLLQDTVDQFEKVIDLERTLLRKSIRKLEHDLEEISTELGMKEEELVVWEEKVQQIQQDNEVKLNLAKSRFVARGRPRGRSAPAGTSTTPLGFIAEVDEADAIEEGDEDEEEEEDLPPLERKDSSPTLNDDEESKGSEPGPFASLGFGAAEEAPASPPAPAVDGEVEAVNALADIVAGELSLLRKQWQDLDAGITGSAAGSQSQATASNANGRSSVMPSTQPTPSLGMSQLLNDRSRLTVEQRIDRLQRDIRTETDRILQERGTPNSAASRLPRTGVAPSLPLHTGLASTSAADGQTPIGSSAGSLVASVGGVIGRDLQTPTSKTGNGLRTPVQSTSSRSNNPSLVGSSEGSSSRGERVNLQVREQDSVAASPTLSAAPPASPTAMSVTPQALPLKAPGFQPVGAVMRCISPTNSQVPPVSQVGRARPVLPSRPVTNMAPAAGQSSSSTPSGVQRIAFSANSGYPPASQVQTTPGASQTGATVLASSSPSPPPVIGSGGGIPNARGSSGSSGPPPNGGQRGTFAAGRRSP